VNILFILPRYHTNLVPAVNGLLSAGHGVTIFAKDAEELEDYSAVRPEILAKGQLTYTSIHARLKRQRPDVVIIREHAGQWGRFYAVARMMGIKCVGYNLRPYHNARSWLGRVGDAWLGFPFKRMTPNIGDVSRAADRLAFYVPLPVKAEPEVDDRTYAPNGIVRILCVGKLAQPRKRHFLLIEALESLSGVMPRAQFSVTLTGNASADAVGRSADYLRRLHDYCRSGILASCITMHKNVPYKRMLKLYSQHDICVLPAVKEPFGMAPVEAMAAGCTAIVANDCGSASYIRDGITGYIFESGHLDSLRNVLQTLLDKPERVETVGRAAYEAVKKYYSPDSFATRLSALVEDL
jgi:glycosyltransferase involved in cell wall biosynthesis